MRILKELCAVPTAPFVEGQVVEYVERFVRQRRNLRLSRDEDGNLLIELRGRKRGLPRWVFGAHMDHPGFVTRAMEEARMVRCDFRGWVLAEYVMGTKVRFFDNGREVAGRVIEVTAEKKPLPGRGPRAVSARVRVNEPVAANVPGMFDQGEGRVKGGKFYCRVCDDLAGAAAALAMMDELHRKPPASPVAVLLTRAEEEGFVGAIAAARKPRLLRRATDRIIAIETSAEQPHAPQGAGPIIRVGDRTSIFNSALTYFLTQQAEGIARRRKTFRYQRALMPGGTCEATVYDVYGFHAASICVALGNYHNMDRGRERIGPEYVDVGDWRGMVELFVAVARNGHEYDGTHVALKQRLDKRFEGLKHLLKS